MAAFDDALALVLEVEGGRVDDPRDPGGRTNHGITQHTYDAWRARAGLPRRDVFLIGAEDVAAIFRCQYADPIRFDDLPAGVGYAVFDEAVNAGPIVAARGLQGALGIARDGAIGIATLAALHACADRSALIQRLCDTRLGFLGRLRTWPVFGRGWTARVEFVRARALAMAAA